jgi:hypothetical protein
MIIVNPAKPTIFTVAIMCLLVSTTLPLASQEMPEPSQDIWLVHPMHFSPLIGSSTPQGYSPNQIRTAYNLPSIGGAGCTIAIIVAYDTPTILDDYTVFCNQYGLPDNTTGNFIVHKMAGVTTAPSSSWPQETCLDVEWAHAIAPQATILLVTAKGADTNSLFQAIDYATSQPDVVAVSMSWGTIGDEPSYEAMWDYHFDQPGIVFFASSGDDGAGITYPAVSPNVVSVGGTVLSFNGDGSVSETGWSGSGGGVSAYEPIPDYQRDYGLTGSKRYVPDVSYNAGAGVAVYYDGLWYPIGGTSAGAPQWAAIHALACSAINNNLYQKATSTYSSYFRDIVSGSNGAYTAAQGYDCVTGLGSPLTFNFGVSFYVSPTSGSAGTPVTLSGSGFVGNSVNLSYANPVTSSWATIENNIATTSGNFTFSLNAPDLLRNSAAGDNPASSDTIVFRVIDNGNGYAYNTTVPYTEYRRGLTQVGNAVAHGLFGNNTDLSGIVLNQTGDALSLVGNWFNPRVGTATLLWDNQSLGSTAIDATGSFSTTITVPATSTGQHTLTINDSSANFCVSLTRVPFTLNDYVNTWYTSDFTVTLTPDSPVDETFYRINGGSTQNITFNGQPVISTEGGNNTLEYWSLWNLIELPHTTVNDIKLDKTAPTGSITPNLTETQTRQISLNLSAVDSLSGVAQMRFANEIGDWTGWEPYAASKAWVLTDGDDLKTVSVEFKDTAGVVSVPYSCTVTLQLPQATQNPHASTSPTTSPTTSSPTPAQPVNTPTDIPITQPSSTPTVPEFSFVLMLLLIVASTALVLAGVIKKKQT